MIVSPEDISNEYMMGNSVTDPEGGKSLSDIQKFYRGANVFITGVTGFLGHVLLSKLLKSCPDIKNVYVLIREKRGKTTDQRFQEMFASEVFAAAKEACPDYAGKVKAIIGDCSKVGLGIKESDAQLLKDEIAVVFHVAATVRFDSPLKEAVRMNVSACSELLDLARSMKQLKAFVHVSTAYSHCVGNDVIEEKFYDPPIALDQLCSIVDNLDEDRIDQITPAILGSYPNTYVFTKAMAEEVCRKKGKDIPLVLFRPAIVISAYEEPLPGWINNIYGPTGVVAAAGAGILRVLPCNGVLKNNAVPCDFVMNAAIASAWKRNKMWESENAISKSEESTPIYNFSCNALKDKAPTWNEYMTNSQSKEAIMPLYNAVWAYGLVLTKTNWFFHIYSFLFQYLPALVIDNSARILGKKPVLMGAYHKINKLIVVLRYFTMREWTIVDDNVQSLWAELSELDKNTFRFDMKLIDWEKYYYTQCDGIRKYIVKEGVETIPAALKKRKKLLAVHYAFQTLLIAGVSWFAYNIYNLFAKIQY